MKRKISAVLFDLDNTFYEYEPCHKAALEACAKRAAKKYFFTSKASFIKSYAWARSEVKKNIPDQAGSHSRILYFQRIAERNAKLKPGFAPDLASFYWKVFLSRMKLEKGALSFLQYLKNQKFKTAVISDMTAEVQLQKLEKLGISRFVDCLVTSEEAGNDKPNPRMAYLALHKLKVKARSVCVVGDHYHRDIRLARKIGAVSIWYCRSKSRKIVSKTLFAVKNFSELQLVFKQLTQ